MITIEGKNQYSNWTKRIGILLCWTTFLGSLFLIIRGILFVGTEHNAGIQLVVKGVCYLIASGSGFATFYGNGKTPRKFTLLLVTFFSVILVLRLYKLPLASAS